MYKNLETVIYRNKKNPKYVSKGRKNANFFKQFILTYILYYILKLFTHFLDSGLAVIEFRLFWSVNIFTGKGSLGY
jgi:VanZ family protein